MLGIVIVIYKSFNRTKRFVKTELAKIKIPNKVVIVSNGSTVEENEKLAKAVGAFLIDSDKLINLNYDLFVIGSEDNLGYAKGNNLGAKFLYEHFQINYFLFSNDDIELSDSDAINKLIDVLDGNPEIALVGPRITRPDGSEVVGHTENISIYRRIGWNLFPFLKGKKPQIKQNGTDINMRPYPCVWVSGCFFVIKSVSFKEINGFDNDTFLYGEEIILSEKLRRNGQKVFFHPNASVIHNHGQTTQKELINGQIKKLVIQSDILYYRKYKRVPEFFIRLYYLSYKLNMLLYNKKSAYDNSAN